VGMLVLAANWTGIDRHCAVRGTVVGTNPLALVAPPNATMKCQRTVIDLRAPYFFFFQRSPFVICIISNQIYPAIPLARRV
jgi:hypothetical protein